MSKLLGDKFKKDKRVTRAKKLLKEALKAHQSKLTEIKPPDPKLKKSYDKMIADYFGGGESLNLSFEKVCDLRYGENPHQQAKLFREQRTESKEQRPAHTSALIPML